MLQLPLMLDFFIFIFLFSISFWDQNEATLHLVSVKQSAPGNRYIKKIERGKSSFPLVPLNEPSSKISNSCCSHDHTQPRHFDRCQTSTGIISDYLIHIYLFIFQSASSITHPPSKNSYCPYRSTLCFGFEQEKDVLDWRRKGQETTSKASGLGWFLGS